MEVKRDRHGRPRVYLEEDCPVQEISIESQRERGASSALPPLYFLHVWWARRPLTVSRAAVLGSLLPAGYDPKEFLRLMGIEGDPVADRAKIDDANLRGAKLKIGFTYKRAFSNSISDSALAAMRKSIKVTWNDGDLAVLDSFTGGGSIPFEAVRMGFDTVANELNPVASVIERATIEYPARFGTDLVSDIELWGQRIAKEVEAELRGCFPKRDGEEIFGYIWVRTVRCDKCGLMVPLAPNFWLDSANKLGFRLAVPKDKDATECSFSIEKSSANFDPEQGSVTRGMGTCPRCPDHHVLEGPYIKNEAQQGRMGHQLAAVGYKLKGKSGRFFREAEKKDLEGVAEAAKLLKKKLPGWERKGLVPDEDIPEGNKTREPRNSGTMRWRDMFSPRQLLVHLTTMENILGQPWDEVKDPKKREALRVYMQLAFDKAISHDSTQSRYDPGNNKVCNAFERHDFAFKWSFAEIDGAGQLFRFGHEQIADAYKGLSKLLLGAAGTCRFLTGDAANLTSVETGSVNLICIDPPYYDNVMYSECSDFFYVWMKRGLGDVFPSMFQNELTDKDRESVANVSRFKEAGSGKARDRASRDYEAKMQNAFREMHRVLRDDGVMTIMFTHKSVDAWDVLAYALLEADFEITASWPIHTESQHSLHQAKKNAAASTILLVCRKRPKGTKSAWWEELQQRVDEVVKAKAERFAAQGLSGQDMSIACFGPTLEVISEGWPVKKKDGTVIRPDEALDRARTVMSSWLIDRIAEGKAESLDPRTRFYILLWHLFGVREVSFDEARKLGISLNVEIEDLLRSKVLEKRGQYVRIMKPEERSRAKGLRPDAKSYDFVIDYIQAAMHAYESGQSAELNRFHQRTGALVKEGYREAIALLLDVLPRTDEVVEYGLLDQMWESNYRDQVKRKPRTSAVTDKKQTKLEVK